MGAWTPILSIDVTYRGAIISWRSPDHAMSRYDALMTRHGAAVAQRRGQRAAAMTDEERIEFAREVEDALRSEMPDELGQIMCDMFVEGVFGWEGVCGAMGGRLDCNAGTRRAIPYEDKLAVTALYLARLREIELGKAAPPAPPTSCTADGAATGGPSESGSARVQDSATPTAPEP